ncbi:translation elongation factor Ts [Leuconostoc mesenteroides]|uniref:translation elongation factor Ts n=1 Tax=Leuconostoc mesenteroides TaxID=1245 RepID=UPI000A04E02D|nr:translation elongation factor Ts [Leuconostoc mesenteroides]ORI47958.1 translation elongation factor Ts [Leuconostoc mesenteroides subsp. cremoris]ORI49050.1 translation elongation factor Ts [Leuconostoc mesenteroides subsp. cremoris]ORI50726.1 translation elongation factor Ts [Leuconostoc mesenteroides subsp. cremoris]ORI58905.1 translation elongation factor Ts [Leuconostoc mesenteroides subsp. cremoris]ORI61248.1 translation elongation factor Ts [Leuconostoc mesenteroides subsp. cremoris]
MAITAAQVKELRDKTSVGMMDAKKALVEADGDLDKAIDLLREKGMAKAAKKGDRVAAEGMTAVAVKGNRAAIIELNSETDFVAGNAEFNELLNAVANTIVEFAPADVEAALALEVQEGQTLNDKIIGTTQITGEKITLRRFSVVEKSDSENFGSYSHLAGSISALVVVDGASEEAAKDIAMHVAAIAPQFVSDDQVPADVIAEEKEVQLASEDLNGKPDNIKERMVEGRIKKFLAEISLLDQPFVKNGDQTVAQFISSQNGSVKSFVRYQVGDGIEKQVTDLAEEVAKQLG